MKEGHFYKTVLTGIRLTLVILETALNCSKVPNTSHSRPMLGSPERLHRLLVSALYISKRAYCKRNRNFRSILKAILQSQHNQWLNIYAVQIILFNQG